MHFFRILNFYFLDFQFLFLYRQNKEWKKSDELRDKIKQLGYIIGDTKEGYEIRKA